MKQIDFSSKKSLLFIYCVFFSIIFSACKKDLNNLKPTDDNPRSVNTNEYVTGAHGELILKKNFHLIENGYKLAIQNGHIYKAEIASGKLLEDFGEYKPVTTSLRSMTSYGAGLSKGKNPTYGNSYSWVAAAEWDNTAGNAINSFNATCVVPPLPSNTNNQQTFAFWIGISSAQDGGGNIVQPILNYGQPPNTHWTNTYQVFNYFYWADGAAMTSPVTVSSGATIQFAISYNWETDGSYDYISNILNSNGVTIGTTMDIYVGNSQNYNAESQNPEYAQIPVVDECNSAYAVLEIPGGYINSTSEYPNAPSNQSYVAMTDIAISTGTPTQFTYPSSLSWNKLTESGAQNGEHAQIISTNNNTTTSPGQIELWYNLCQAPTSPVGTPVQWTNSTQTLSWGAVTGATQYQIIINSGPDGGGPWYITTSTSISNFFRTIEQPAIPGNYQVIIFPQNSCGDGPNTYFNFTYTE